MKKPENRIRRNGHTKTVKPQAKTAREKIVTINFFCEEDGRDMFQVDFPEPFYRKIVHAAKQIGITLGQFFELAIKSQLEDNGIKLPAVLIAGGGQ